MKEETIIKNDWCNYFGLTPISQSKYYKIVGCFILGFELVRTQCEIQPHFVLYPLWKKDIKTNMQFPYILHCINDSRGINYQISISEMLKQKEAIFLDIERVVGFDLTKNISKEDILKIVEQEQYSKMYVDNPYHQGILSELKIYLSVYANDKDLYMQTIAEIDDIYSRINRNIFKYWFGDFYKWKNNLELTFAKRQDILKTIRENIANCKIKTEVQFVD